MSVLIRRGEVESVLHNNLHALIDTDQLYQLYKDINRLPAYSSPDSENKGWWIPFSEELPPKGEKVHVSTFGIVTIGERTSDANEALRLSILEPMNNMYKNIDPYSYQITHWQPLPEPYKGE